MGKEQERDSEGKFLPKKPGQKLAGIPHQDDVGEFLKKKYGKDNVFKNVKIKNYRKPGGKAHPGGTDIDYVVRDPNTGKLRLFDAKPHEGGVRGTQVARWSDIEMNGGVIATDKFPHDLPRGKEIPPTKVEKIRPNHPEFKEFVSSRQGVVGTRGTGSTARDNPGTKHTATDSPAQTTQQLPPAKSVKFRVKLRNLFKKIDISKIRIVVKNAIITHISTVKNIGKGLVRGILVGFITDYLKTMLLRWLLSDSMKKDAIRKINELQKKAAPEIKSKIEEAINEYAYNLQFVPYLKNYKCVLQFRLINMFVISSFYLPHKLIIDGAYVTTTAHGAGSVKVNTKNNFSVQEGKLGPDDIFEVYKCSDIIDFVNPQLGEPSIIGEWKIYFFQSKAPKTKIEIGKFIFDMSKDQLNVIIKSAIWKRQDFTQYVFDKKWDGKNLRLEFKTGKNKTWEDPYTNFSVYFEKWDILTGTYTRFINEYEQNFESQFKIQLDRVI